MRAPGAAADGADARPACVVEGASPVARCRSHGAATANMLTRCLAYAPQRHKRAVLRQQPGLPDPLYAAKGRFPAGYPNPDDESVRARLCGARRRGMALLPHAAACAAPNSDCCLACRKGRRMQSALQECAASTCRGLLKQLRLPVGKGRDGVRRNASANANGPPTPLLAMPTRRRPRRALRSVLRRPRHGQQAAPSSALERSAVQALL